MTFKEEEEEEEGDEGKKKEELKVLARGIDKMELSSIVKEKRTSADTGLLKTQRLLLHLRYPIRQLNEESCRQLDIEFWNPGETVGTRDTCQHLFIKAVCQV